jgi:predicted ester cyclase
MMVAMGESATVAANKANIRRFVDEARPVDFRSIVFNRFEDGVVVENWGLHDHARALDQLTGEGS